MGTQKKKEHITNGALSDCKGSFVLRLKGDPPHSHLLSGAHNSREKKLLFRSGDWEKIEKNKGKTG